MTIRSVPVCTGVFLLLLSGVSELAAQPITDAEGDVGIGTFSPHASSRLDLVSTSKGFLIPRMTTAQRNAIAGPAPSLMIFNTDDGDFQYWDANTTQWETFITTANANLFTWRTIGNNSLTAWNGVTGNFLGMQDNVDLVLKTENADMQFWTNNTHRAGFTSAGNFEPAADNTYDLGSNANRWQDLYVDGGSAHIGPTGGEGVSELQIGYGAGTASLNTDGGGSEIDITTVNTDVHNNLNVGLNLDVTGIATLNGPVALGDAAADPITLNGTLTGSGSDHSLGTFGTDANVLTINGLAGTAPAYELDVQGDANIAGLLALPGLTSGSVVYVDGAGNLATDNPPFAYDDGTNTMTTENLVVTNSSDLRGTVSNSTANLNLDDDVDVTGILDAQSTIVNTLSDVTVDDNLDVNDNLNVDGTSTLVGVLDAQSAGNTIGDGTASTQLTIDGVQDAAGTETLPDAAFDLAVNGDIGASGVIKSGAGVWLDGVSATHSLTADQPLDVNTLGTNGLTLSTNSSPAVSIDGTTQNVNVLHDLDVDGAANVDGPTTLNATLDVDGITDLHSNLNVDGPTDLNSTLNVDGASTFNNTITQTGGGQVTLSGNLNADNGVDITGGDLTVGGANFTVDVTNGNTTVAGIIDGNAAANELGDGTAVRQLTVQGAADAVIGNTIGGNPTVWDEVVDGDLGVTGIIKTGGSVWIDGVNDVIASNNDFTLTTSGEGSDLILGTSSGHVRVLDELGVTGTFTGNANDNLMGDGNGGRQLTVHGDGLNNVANGYELYVEGDANIDGTLTVGTLDLNFDPGSVIFAGAGGELAEDNANFYWDDTEDFLGIGTGPFIDARIESLIDAPETPAMLGVNNSGPGVRGETTTGTAVYGQSFGNGTALRGFAGGVGTGLEAESSQGVAARISVGGSGNTNPVLRLVNSGVGNTIEINQFNGSSTGDAIDITEAGSGNGITINAGGAGLGLEVNGGAIDGNTAGNELGAGTAATQLSISGVQDATGAETIPDAAFDLAVAGDIGATGIIKSGAGIWLDGVSATHSLSADQPLNINTVGANDLTLSTNSATAVTIDGTTQQVTIAGDFAVGNDLTVPGDLNFAGATSTIRNTGFGAVGFASDLTLISSADIILGNGSQIYSPGEAVTVHDDFTVEAGDLAVTGGGLNVVGNTTLGDASGDQHTVNGNMDVSNGLDVTGGDLTVGSNFSVVTGANSRLTANDSHVRSTQTTAPVAAVAGANVTSAVLSNATDVAGAIDITTSGSAAVGAQATVTFAVPYGSAPIVNLTPASLLAPGVGAYVTRTTNGFTINFMGLPANGTSYEFFYQVIETQ